MIDRPTPTGAEDAPDRLPGESTQQYAQRLVEWRRSRAQRLAFMGLKGKEDAPDAGAAQRGRSLE